MTKTVTTTLYLCASQADWAEDGVHHSITTTDIGGSNGYVTRGKMEISMDIPEGDITNEFIEGMRQEQDKLKAEAHLKVENLEEQIQSLLALPAP